MKKEKPLDPPPLKVGARRPTATDQEVQLFSSCLAFPLSDGLPSFACQRGKRILRDPLAAGRFDRALDDLPPVAPKLVNPSREA